MHFLVVRFNIRRLEQLNDYDGIAMRIAALSPWICLFNTQEVEAQRTMVLPLATVRRSPRAATEVFMKMLLRQKD